MGACVDEGTAEEIRQQAGEGVVEMKVRYKGYIIERNWVSKIPQFDEWIYAHEEYDGPEDPRCGACKTFEECKEEIDDLENGNDDLPVEDFDYLEEDR